MSSPMAEATTAGVMSSAGRGLLYIQSTSKLLSTSFP